MSEPKVMTRPISLVEILAEAHHDAWVEWSKAISLDEDLSFERLQRWQRLWIAYAELPDAEKERDRGWARKTIQMLVEAGRQPMSITGEAKR